MKPILLILSLFFLTACTNIKEKEHKQVTQAQTKIIEITSVKDLNELFNDFNYTSKTWENGLREVPRIYFTKVSQTWEKNSNNIPLREKKNIFFRLLGPLVLMSNEDIMIERLRLKKEDISSQWTKDLALKYKVLKKTDTNLSSSQFLELKKRVDIIPTSLALAQGAEESGWGTSRFAAQGNALFGQWDFSSKGMKPLHPRKELGDYTLARFDTPLDSVKGYMLNLNTTGAYKELRTRRLQCRQDGEKITGWELAKTLDKYSEKGQEYINGLHQMISYNKLQATDDAYLSNGPAIHLKKVKN